MILNLGSGSSTYGDIRLDMTKNPNVTIIAEAHHLPFKTETFDQVYSQNIFEHLRDPGTALKEQERVLKHGGTLVLTTDNATYWRNILTTKSGHTTYKTQNPNDMHYALYLPFHLRNYLSQTTLTITRTEYVKPREWGATGAINKLLRLVPFLNHASYGAFKITATKK